MGVYFITDGELVKIGYTNQSPQKRIKALQTGNPKPLSLIAFKPEWGREKEQELHESFSHLRVNGEWFNREGDLDVFLDSICAREPGCTQKSVSSWHSRRKANVSDEFVKHSKEWLNAKDILAQKLAKKTTVRFDLLIKHSISAQEMIAIRDSIPKSILDTFFNMYDSEEFRYYEDSIAGMNYPRHFTLGVQKAAFFIDTYFDCERLRFVLQVIEEVLGSVDKWYSELAKYRLAGALTLAEDPWGDF